jgi:hypothetical protein
VGTSEELFELCINELKKEHYTTVNFPIHNFLNIRSIVGEYASGIWGTLVINYSFLHEGRIVSLLFSFQGSVEDFIHRFEGEGGYNRLEGYVSGELRGLGSKLIGDSNLTNKEGF